MATHRHQPDQGLAELHRRLDMAGVPGPRRNNLRLATWNIRELGKSPRWDESIALLAATIARFDLVSVVELRDNLEDLRRILACLGPRWRAVFSDYRLDAGGNRERVGFLHNTSRVSFTGLASHAEAERVREGDEYTMPVPWWRPPFLASFAAGSLEFVLVAAHVRWGRTVAGREAEVAALASWAARRAAERSFAGQDFVLVGDYNLPSQRSPVWDAFEPAGFAVPGDRVFQGTSARNECAWHEHPSLVSTPRIGRRCEDPSRAQRSLGDKSSVGC